MSSSNLTQANPITHLERLFMTTTIVLLGLISGFFYAYSSSVMFGLDASEPNVAIAAMQGINREVRNLVFAPAFFGTPLVAALTAGLLYFSNKKFAALIFVSAGLLYVAAAMAPTFLINVPMNDGLAGVVAPNDIAEAKALWLTYSTDWTWWNSFRTITSTLSLALAVFGLEVASRKFDLSN